MIAGIEMFLGVDGKQVGMKMKVYVSVYIVQVS